MLAQVLLYLRRLRDDTDPDCKLGVILHLASHWGILPHKTSPRPIPNSHATSSSSNFASFKSAVYHFCITYRTTKRYHRGSFSALNKNR
jgi:hypothetical protein